LTFIALNPFVLLVRPEEQTTAFRASVAVQKSAALLPQVRHADF
jgi:hypothetical protein